MSRGISMDVVDRHSLIEPWRSTAELSRLAYVALAAQVRLGVDDGNGEDLPPIIITSTVMMIGMVIVMMTVQPRLVRTPHPLQSEGDQHPLTLTMMSK